MKKIIIIAFITVLSACNLKPDGEVLYQAHCAECHAPAEPGRFLQHMSPNTLGRITYWDVVKQIRSGAKHESALKPLFEGFSKAEAEALAKYLFDYKKRYFD